MVQPQLTSNTSSIGLMQRRLSSSLKGMLPQSQPRRVKHGSGGSISSGNSSIVLRIAMISCFLIILVYVIYYLSRFHIFILDAKKEQQQLQSPLLIRKNKEPQNENLQIAVNVAKNIIMRQTTGKANQQLEQLTDKKDILVVTTKVGEIRIMLRSDLSPESVSFVRQMATTPNACVRCNIYRAEKPGILQGIIANPKISLENIPKGKCPVGFENVPNACPEWDIACSCHGPIMTKGMVGWAAGATGPDFFIDTYERDAKWWGTQHTVFGEIQDSDSFQVINLIYNTLPTQDQGGLTILKEPLKFTLSLV